MYQSIIIKVILRENVIYGRKKHSMRKPDSVTVYVVNDNMDQQFICLKYSICWSKWRDIEKTVMRWDANCHIHGRNIKHETHPKCNLFTQKYLKLWENWLPKMKNGFYVYGYFMNIILKHTYNYTYICKIALNGIMEQLTVWGRWNECDVVWNKTFLLFETFALCFNVHA